MPEPAAVPIDTGMVNGASNGVNGGHVPRNPSITSLTPTEYSANPSPSSERRHQRIQSIVPEEFILPSGHPDVRYIHTTPPSGLSKTNRCF